MQYEIKNLELDFVHTKLYAMNSNLYFSSTEYKYNSLSSTHWYFST